MSAQTNTPACIFDPAELFAQLSRLLALYLARAGAAEALASLAPKDALAAAKTAFELMAALQAGKLSAVDEDTQWPRAECVRAEATFPPRAGGKPGRLPSFPPGSPVPGGGAAPGGEASGAPAILDFEAAVAAVCQWDEETAHLEPYARLVARINRLSDLIEADLTALRAAAPQDAASASASVSAPPPPPPSPSPLSAPPDHGNGKQRLLPQDQHSRSP